MGLQEQAAAGLAEALAKRHFGVVQAFNNDGVTLHITEYPHARVYFKRDQLGGLYVDYVFDGRAPRRFPGYVPAAAAAEELAQIIVDQIAGAGGGTTPVS